MTGLALSLLAAYLPATGLAWGQAPITELLREADAKIQEGKLVEAESLLQRAIQRAPRNAMAHNLMGIVLDQQGRAGEAERSYREALRLDPQLIGAQANLGVLFVRTKRPEQAIEAFEKVLRQVPNHPQATYNLGLLYAARGDYGRAIPLLEAINGISKAGEIPKQIDPPLLLALIDAYLRGGRLDAARPLIDDLEAGGGNNPPLLFNLGLSLAAAREYQRAVSFFERTNRLRPGTFEVLYNLGVAYYNLDRLSEAAEALQAAANLSPQDPEPLYRLGLVASAQGHSELALTMWQRALKLRENFPQANFMIGEELLKTNRNNEIASQFLERAIAQDGTKLVYYVRLGAAYIRIQEYAKAQQVFERAASLFPESPDAHYLIGYAARGLAKYDEALRAFAQADKLRPDHPETIANLGFIAGERGQHAEAERLLRRAIELDPKPFPPYYDLGRLLVRRRRFEEAVPVLRQGIELKADDPGIHYQLFTALSRLNRREEAEKEFALFQRLEAARKQQGKQKPKP